VTPDTERLLEDARDRRPERMSDRQFVTEALSALLFLLAATVLAEVASSGHVPVLTAIVLTVCLAGVNRVEFDVGSGFSTPTQIVFVPMLFLLPPAIVPLCVAAASVLDRLPDFLARRRHAERVLLALSDSWFALGPAIVFAATGVHDAQWSAAPIYLAALGSQFAVDFAGSAARQYFGFGIDARRHLREMTLVWIVDSLLAPIGLLAAFGARHGQYGFLAALPLAGLLAVFARERRARIDQALELSATYRRTALLLGDVIGDDDAYTGIHSQGVVSLAVAVADELHVDEGLRRQVEFGALLHDVGKIAMPKGIINKPEPLTDDERALMRRHTIEGQRMLDRVGGALHEVGVIVRASHERWDGAGYPDGLRADEIPLAARIIACADAFSAMTTDRPYRQAMSSEAAVAELRAGKSTQFDPDIVDATVTIVERYRLPRRAKVAVLPVPGGALAPSRPLATVG